VRELEIIMGGEECIERHNNGKKIWLLEEGSHGNELRAERFVQLFFAEIISSILGM
jgi:hypothetical protein